MPGRAVGMALLMVCVSLCSCSRFGDRETEATIRASQASQASTESYEEIDPALLAYTPEREIDLAFDEPRGIAIGPDDRLFVVGDGRLSIDAHDPAAHRQLRLPDEPHCLAVDETGAMVIGYREHVRRHQADGAIVTEWALPGESPYVTCVLPVGDELYVADAGNRVILRYDSSGQVIGRIGEKDEAAGVPGLVIPSYHLDVALGPDGMLMVNNPGLQALETYTSDGTLCSSWRKASMEIDGFCGCCNPVDIAVLPDRRVITSEKGVPRVKVLEPDGTLSGVVVGSDGLSRTVSALDIAVDSAGRVYVLDPPAGVVRVFAPKPTEEAAP